MLFILVLLLLILFFFFFFFNDPAPTEIYPLPLHDALPIWLLLERDEDVPLEQLARLRLHAEVGMAPELGRRVVEPIDEVREPADPGLRERSEEHTSELQSPCNLVCRLLLEKKKKKKKKTIIKEKKSMLKEIMYNIIMVVRGCWEGIHKLKKYDAKAWQHVSSMWQCASRSV